MSKKKPTPGGRAKKDADTERKERAARLIAALSCGRNTEPIGRLDRDEIYDRQITTARTTTA